jgi:hypothetical protein
MMGWSKLFSDIVCSSIWNEDDPTRIVWITILAIKGPNHIVRATVGGLAHQARVSLESCRMAINKLSSPDPDGMDQPYEGRRIQEVEHGWLVLNGEKYKNRRDETYRKQYQAEWVKAKRIKQKLSTEPVDVDTASTSVDTNRSDQIRTDKKSKSKNGASAPTHKHSKPDSFEELKAYVVDKLNLEENDAAALWEHWKGNGFKNAGRPIVDWRMVASNWERRGFFFPSIQQPRFQK